MAQAILYPEQSKQVDDVATVSAVVTSLNVSDDGHRKNNRIQVSNTKKPLFFYLNLAKRYMKQHNDVELSALGMAIPTLVTISEILKANGVAVEKKVITSTVDSKDETKGRVVQKAKLEIFLEKREKQPVSPKADNTASTEGSEAKASSDQRKTENKSTTSVDRQDR